MTRAVEVMVPFCGLPCAPVRLEVEGEVVKARGGGCPACRAAVEAPAVPGPPLVAGRPASLEEAIARAAGLLRAARSPLVYGLAHSTCGTARSAAAIAQRLRGVVDIEGSECLQPEIDVVQSSGACMATYGAIRTAADVVLLWRIDPRETHPELLGPPPGAQERRIILVTDPGTGMATGADRLVRLPRDRDVEAVLALRALVAGRAPRAGSVPADQAAALAAAAETLRAARTAAILHAPAWRDAAEGRAMVAGLQALAATLQETTRAAAVSLGAGGNVAGGIAALLAACGLPRAVSFRDRTPRSCAGRTASADAVLCIGRHGGRNGGPLGAALGETRGAPFVVVGPRPPADPVSPAVIIPTAVPALSETGVWLRADGVPVTLAAPVETRLPREGEVLRRLLERLEATA